MAGKSPHSSCGWPSTLYAPIPVSKTSCAPHWPTRVKLQGAKLLLTQSKKNTNRQDPNPMVGEVF